MTPPDPHAPDGDLSAEPPAEEAALHAVLDDEATPEERRLVARDPRLVARLAELRTVADSVRALPEPPPPDALERIRHAAIAAALDSPAVEPVEAAAADEPPVAPAGAGHDDQGEAPDDLAARRVRRGRRLPPLPAVAAVVVLLLAIGVGLIATGQGNGEGTAASRAGDSLTSADDADSGGGGGSGEESGAGAEAEATDEAPAAGGSGRTADEGPDFPDDEALRVALQQTDPAVLELAPPAEGAEEGPAPDPAAADAARQESEGPAARRCNQVLQASDASIELVVAATTATVAGEPRLVLTNPVSAREDAPASTQITVFEPESCVPLFAVQRAP